MTPMTTAKKPPALSAKHGMIRTPTTLVSLRRTPGNWVCFWYQTSAEVHADQRQHDARDQQDVQRCRAAE